MNLSKENFYKLEKAINLLEDMSKDIETTNDIEVIISNASSVISELNQRYNSKDKKRVAPFILEEKHINYLESVRAELMQAEKIIDDIKESEEWKTVMIYFNTYYTRGKLSVRPMKKNGYVYKENNNYHNNKPLLQENVDYLERTRIELVKAEQIVDKIKKSVEWKKCQMYFITCERRNLLDSRPTKKNGYTYKVKEF